MRINRIYSLRHKYKYKLLILQIYREVFANKKRVSLDTLNEKDMDRACIQAQESYEPKPKSYEPIVTLTLWVDVVPFGLITLPNLLAILSQATAARSHRATVSAVF